jgi:hypothetical protein
MSYKSIILRKCVYYNNYIINNGLIDKLFDPSKKVTYNLNSYLHIYFLFQKSGLSYDMFYEIFNYANSLDTNNYPKKSSLHEFKKKLSKLDLHHTIHDEHINDVITDDCLIDSVNISNKNNSTLIGDYNYKGKKGVKITHITNDVGFPLIPSIDPGNDNDAKIGLKVIKDNTFLLKKNNVTILGDKGYDSQTIRDFVHENGFSVIIPKNIRRTDNAKIKEIKQTEKEKINNKRKRLMIAQKNLRKQIKQKLVDRRRINKLESNNINKISIKQLDNIIKTMTTKIDRIKDERKELPIKLKSNIKNEINKVILKDKQQKCAASMGFRLCAFCNRKTICNECEKCKKCNKNLKYYKGLTNEEIIRYTKRIRVEHFISHYKNGRTLNLKDKKRNMLIDTVYNRYTDFLFIKNIIKR